MTSKNLKALFGAVLLVTTYTQGAAAAAPSPLSEQNARELERLLAVPAGTLPVSCSDRTPPRTPVRTLGRYLLWNEIALDTTAIDHTPNPQDPQCFGVQFGPHRASRAMAIVHIAMFDAVNAISQKYVSYSKMSPGWGNVSLDRAIAQAAHDTLVALYPGQQPRLDSIFEIDIAKISGGPASIAAGAALGMQAAQAILNLRLRDGSQLPEPTVRDSCSPSDDTCFPANHDPGKWQIDPISGLTLALGAHWGQVMPFVMQSADQFRPVTPPFLTDHEYKKAWKEVFLIGGDPAHGTSTIRTAMQTHIGKFWAYDATPGLCAPPRLYNQIVRTIALQQRTLRVPEIARLFALANVAMADAGIAAWEAKYFYQYWRPVTAIRNASTHADPTWYPLGAPNTNTNGPNLTPPWPAYPSGHATIGGAVFEILRKFWPDHTRFTFISDEWNGKNRDVDGNFRPLWPLSFNSFHEAERKNAQSRIYLGIHWQFDADMGIRLGNLVGDYVFDHAFRPVNDGLHR